jgi:curved DNA-binding protein CbpA
MSSSLTGIDLLLCCCAGCIRGDDNSTELYSALNLSPSATAEDIRKAWRSYSLRLHPDKLAQRGKTVTPDDQAQFIRAKDAHSVLSDPLRRRMYDSYGANGVKWAEDPSSIDPHTIYKNFTHATTADRARVVLMFALITGAVLLFPILLCLKIDGAGLSWVLVALPLLVLELLWLTLQLMGLAAIKRARGRAKRRQQQRSSQPDCGTSHQQGDGVGATKEDPTGNSSSDDDDDDDDDGTDDVDNLLGEEDDDKDPWGRKMALEIALVGAAGTGLALFWQVLVVLKLQVREICQKSGW